LRFDFDFACNIPISKVDMTDTVATMIGPRRVFLNMSKLQREGHKFSSPEQCIMEPAQQSD
jgi:hypothetical protein